MSDAGAGAAAQRHMQIEMAGRRIVRSDRFWYRESTAERAPFAGAAIAPRVVGSDRQDCQRPKSFLNSVLRAIVQTDSGSVGL